MLDRVGDRFWEISPLCSKTGSENVAQVFAYLSLEFNALKATSSFLDKLIDLDQRREGRAVLAVYMRG